jgi:hypothetical protein
MKFLLLPMLGLLAGCAAEVYQEGKTQEQTKRDIFLCHDHGTLMAPYNPVVALEIVYDCLEKKGYKRRSVHHKAG